MNTLSAISEVNENAQVFINGTLYKVPDDNYLGAAPLNFTFDLKKACISVPDINITYDQGYRSCPGQLTCSQHFERGTNLRVTVVLEHSKPITYPEGGEYMVIGGKYRMCHLK